MNINEIMLFVWGGVFAICLLLEIFTSDLVSVWFCGGSLVSIILVSIGWALEFEPMWWISIIVFVFVSCLLLLLLRPITKKYLFKREIKSNVDELIGKKAYVTSPIASTIPIALSPVISLTPDNPRDLSQTKKFFQLSVSSFRPSQAPRISR